MRESSLAFVSAFAWIWRKRTKRCMPLLFYAIIIYRTVDVGYITRSGGGWLLSLSLSLSPWSMYSNKGEQREKGNIFTTLSSIPEHCPITYSFHMPVLLSLFGNPMMHAFGFSCVIRLCVQIWGWIHT